MQAIRDRVILVTGATDGLGRQVARDLAEQGATVLLHGRNPRKGEACLQTIRSATGNDKLKYYNADFSSLKAAHRLAEELRADQSRLDVLINNAGVGGRPGTRIRRESTDGHELCFAVNYLASYLLTCRLLPLLRQSSPSRIVNVSSAGQWPIDFDDVMLERTYDGFRAYAQSKLAQIIFTVDLAAALAESGVTVNSLHPASLMDTNMVRECFGRSMTTVQQGADAVVYLATSPDLDGVTGEYFDGKRRARANPQAYDKEARRRLRQLNTRLIGLQQSD
jgi:NAD(P)-dependent dehydrogenase (short-subunit alcohol dehydrogenase family)